MMWALRFQMAVTAVKTEAVRCSLMEAMLSGKTVKPKSNIIPEELQ
jgi:hypothetical protein